jgi:flavodoxin
MKATVIYESLTGNTRKAGEKIANELNRSGIEAVACSIKAVDLQHLSESDLVVVGSWVDGLFLFGQKPAGVRRLINLPVIDDKKTAVYCTYALETGKTLEKLSGIVERRGGDVIGGMAIKRNKIDEQSVEFVDRLVGVLEADGAFESA